ncbi:MAG: PDZ domain-containing protein, partial [Acidobacteria bacterium]|nr:PDZ domain-containing protein [Acidobacteriota bacterium]
MSQGAPSFQITYSSGFPQERTTLSTVSHKGVPIPTLGITASTAQGNRGAEIMDVAPGSAAEVSGLRVGDVINSANGKPIRAASELA